MARGWRPWYATSRTRGPALIWNKRAPLTEAKDVSADGEKAAWLLLIHTPPSGGDPIDKIGFDWLGGDWGPDQTLHLPIFSDLTFAFHLVAEPDTPLSDRGNRWRPDGMTLRKPFADYISVSRRCQSDQSTWSDLIGNKLPVPIGLYDGEKELDCDGGWTLRILPLRFTPPSAAADYARLDLSTLAPDARYVGVIGDEPVRLPADRRRRGSHAHRGSDRRTAAHTPVRAVHRVQGAA